MSPITRREMLLTVPGLAVASRLLGAQVGPPPIRVRGISSVTLAVSDVARSVAFYQEIFGLPIQARHGSKVLLRLGNGPYFLALMPADGAGPRIDHWGLAVEDVDLSRVADMLGAHGLSRAIDGQGLSGGPMRVRASTRGDTPELHMGDPDGLVMQLQYPTYCGGRGPLGDRCTVEPAPPGAPLSLSGLSHLTINVPDPEATNAFYRRVFGLDVQEYQAASPLLGVGPGPDFLMFIAAGGRGAGAGAGVARVNHVSLALPGFGVERVQSALEAHGIRPRPETSSTGPLLHWVSLRMPNRGGAPEGTPELYFSDPDGLSIQLQDPTYCGGGGYLGEVCNG